VDSVKALLNENNTARRQLEKDVAVVDTRLARFDDHRAAIKTNQEYTALLHEIATAKQEKDGLEERILVQMEAADELGVKLKAADAALAKTKKEADAARAAFGAERKALDGEVVRLAGERKGASAGAQPRALALYEQLLKGRRGVAVASMTNSICGACHVRPGGAARESDDGATCGGVDLVRRADPFGKAHAGEEMRIDALAVDVLDYLGLARPDRDLVPRPADHAGHGGAEGPAADHTDARHMFSILV